MEQYHVFAMPEAREGYGIVTASFVTRDGKGWKIKPSFTGSFEACLKEKRKFINIDKTTAATKAAQ